MYNIKNDIGNIDKIYCEKKKSVIIFLSNKFL